MHSTQERVQSTCFLLCFKFKWIYVHIPDLHIGFRHLFFSTQHSIVGLIAHKFSWCYCPQGATLCTAILWMFLTTSILFVQKFGHIQIIIVHIQIVNSSVGQTAEWPPTRGPDMPPLAHVTVSEVGKSVSDPSAEH